MIIHWRYHISKEKHQSNTLYMCQCETIQFETKRKPWHFEWQRSIDNGGSSVLHVSCSCHIILRIIGNLSDFIEQSRPTESECLVCWKGRTGCIAMKLFLGILYNVERLCDLLRNIRSNTSDTELRLPLWSQKGKRKTMFPRLCTPPEYSETAYRGAPWCAGHLRIFSELIGIYSILFTHVHLGCPGSCDMCHSACMR